MSATTAATSVPRVGSPFDADEVRRAFALLATDGLVEGRMQTRSWDEDGQKRYMTELIAENVTFLGGGNGAQREGAPAGGGFAADPTVGNIDADDLPF